MKLKYFLGLCGMLGVTHQAYAALCQTSESCIASLLCSDYCCPDGTTVDNNTGNITSCYLPSGTAFSDDTGSGIYNTDCYYSN